MAQWLSAAFEIDAVALRDLGLRDAADVEIFNAARAAGAILISKDADFVELVSRLGAPPQLLWVTCGNSGNTRLRMLFAKVLPDAIALLEAGAPIVEIGDAA